jgi:hypothetical protein
MIAGTAANNWFGSTIEFKVIQILVQDDDGHELSGDHHRRLSVFELGVPSGPVGQHWSHGRS